MKAKIKISPELKKSVTEKLALAQAKLNTVLKNQSWVEDVRQYAEKHGADVKKHLSGDIGKAKVFLEKHGKELEKLQKQIPGEVKKFTDFVQVQRKDLEKLLSNVAKASKKKKPARKRTSKKTAAEA